MRYKNIYRTPEAVACPKSLMFIYYCLFPSNWVCDKLSNISYDGCANIYTIEGIKFSGEIFHLLKDESKKGTIFKLIDTGDCVTIKTLRDGFEILDLTNDVKISS